MRQNRSISRQSLRSFPPQSENAQYHQVREIQGQSIPLHPARSGRCTQDRGMDENRKFVLLRIAWLLGASPAQR